VLSTCGGCGGACLFVCVVGLAIVAALVSALAATVPGVSLPAATVAVAPIRCPGLHASQGFGDTPWEHPHTGIDVVCPAGTIVVAVQRGVFHRRYGAGQCVYPSGASGGLGTFGEVDAGDLQYLYGHLEAFAAADGAFVAAGTPIGFEGSTGCSSGYHLHFEVHVAGAVANPCPFLPAGYPSEHDSSGLRCWGAVPP
jgi:murein DD-endopeptidase MepM/ murein hydrolase activator NlpD